MNNDKTPPHSSATKDQWIAAIEEHLATVRWCLDGSQHGGRIKGYSAALLLFCVIDAMGNGLLRPVNLAPAKDDKERWLSTRLDILLHPPFDRNALRLDGQKVEKLTSWYRNKLAHAGALAPNTFLDVGEGDAFNFDENGTPRVLVEALYDVVKVAWEKRNPCVFFELPHATVAPEPSVELVSTFSQSVSGAAVLQGKPMTAEELQQFLYPTKPKDTSA
jgi:hypothetical protein